jgi:hypothetical protein
VLLLALFAVHCHNGRPSPQKVSSPVVRISGAYTNCSNAEPRAEYFNYDSQTSLLESSWLITPKPADGAWTKLTMRVPLAYNLRIVAACNELRAAAKTDYCRKSWFQRVTEPEVSPYNGFIRIVTTQGSELYTRGGCEAPDSFTRLYDLLLASPAKFASPALECDAERLEENAQTWESIEGAQRRVQELINEAIKDRPSRESAARLTQMSQCNQYLMEREALRKASKPNLPR